MPRTPTRITVVLAAALFCGTWPASATDDVSTIRAAQPTIPQDKTQLLGDFAFFDMRYSERQREKVVTGEQWITVANRFERFSRERISFDPDEGGNYTLRAMLIKGEAHLLASMDFFERGDRLFLEQYEKGIELLELVVRAVDGERWSDDDIDFLPEFSRMPPESGPPPPGYVKLHRFSGYETIGTGYVGANLDYYKTGRGRKTRIQRKMKWKVEPPYSDLEEYQVALAKQHRANVVQISTSYTARGLLSDFCPWGVQMYHLLKDAGLTRDLDFKILRPYGGELPAFYERFLAEPDVLPISLSEMVVQPPQVPRHVYDEMMLIRGDGRNGFLGPYRNRPIRWIWVGQPTYTVWFMSPRVFDFNKPSDYLKWWFTAVKIAFGGIGGVVVDEIVGQLLGAIKAGYGETSEIYFSCKMTAGANDLGILTTDAVKTQEFGELSAMTRVLATSVFADAEKAMTKQMYDGVQADSKNLSPGVTYDGTAIPAVILRAEILGFVEVPDDEYPATVQAIRFFWLRPENIAHLGPYLGYSLAVDSTGRSSFNLNLSRGQQYLTEQVAFATTGGPPERVRKLAWDFLPDPMQSFETLTSFAPMRQTMKFRVKTESTEALTGSDRLVAQLWTVTPGAEEQVTRAYIQPGQNRFTLWVHNRDDPALEEDEAYARALDIPVTDDVGAVPKTRYSLKITTLETKKNLGEHTVVLYKKRGQDHEVTGTRSFPNTGEVQLDYEPEIEILTLETGVEGIVAAEPPEAESEQGAP